MWLDRWEESEIRAIETRCWTETEREKRVCLDIRYLEERKERPELVLDSDQAQTQHVAETFHLLSIWVEND